MPATIVISRGSPISCTTIIKGIQEIGDVIGVTPRGVITVPRWRRCAETGQIDRHRIQIVIEGIEQLDPVQRRPAETMDHHGPGSTVRPTIADAGGP